jgi:hypothetical protein
MFPNHSPAPWQERYTHGTPGVFRIYAGETLVTEVRTSDEERQAPDAHLITAAPLLLAETDGVGRAGSFTGVPAIVHSQLMKLRSKTPDERMQISFDVENEGVAKSSQVLHDVEEFGFVQLEPADGHALQVRKERNVRRENRPTSDASTARHPQPPRNRENRQNRTVEARRNSSSSSAPSSGSRRATSRRPQPPRSRENRQNRTPRRLQPPPLPPGASTPGETAPSSATAK